MLEYTTHSALDSTSPQKVTYTEHAQSTDATVMVDCTTGNPAYVSMGSGFNVTFSGTGDNAYLRVEVINNDSGLRRMYKVQLINTEGE